MGQRRFCSGLRWRDVLCNVLRKSWWCGLRVVCGECQIAVRQTRKCLTEICQTWQLGLESRLTQLIAAFLLISPLQEVERWTLTHWKVVYGFQRFLPDKPRAPHCQWAARYRSSTQAADGGGMLNR